MFKIQALHGNRLQELESGIADRHEAMGAAIEWSERLPSREIWLCEEYFLCDAFGTTSGYRLVRTFKDK